MISKAEYFAFHGYKDGDPVAEAAWRDKAAFDAGKRWFAAPMVFVQRDICYDSPIDGRHITSKGARIEDMKRAGCVEYDPEMKTDAQRRLKDEEARLDSAVETHVEAAWQQMPSAKRERLANEIKADVSAETVRLTANGG